MSLRFSDYVYEQCGSTYGTWIREYNATADSGKNYYCQFGTVVYISIAFFLSLDVVAND
jgi:hypothetical protein